MKTSKISSARAPQTAEAQSFEVRLEKPIYGGACLARVDGKAVFAPLTLPGERVRLRVVEDKGSFATAEAEEIVEAAPERIVPRCPYFAACGGCHYQHADYEAQIAMKQAILRETLERAGVAVPAQMNVLRAEPWGYRNRVRLAFDGEGRPGYRGQRSHEVTAIEECPIAAPTLVKAALAAGELLRAMQPMPRARELSLFVNGSGTAMLATLVVESGSRFHFEAFSLALKQRVPALAGAELQVEEKRGGRTLFPRPVAQWGQPSIAYGVAGCDYRVDHGAFFQVNRLLLTPFVERVAGAQGGALAWDLFAGVGLFARQLTRSFARVVAVESAPMATVALAANLQKSCGEAVRATTLEFLRRNASSERPDLIVVDPPRAGLGREVCELLAQVAAPRIVSVSCDPATLARDLRALGESGYRMESLTLADLFPQTFHLETVAVLTRA